MSRWEFYKRRLIRLQPMVVLGSVSAFEQAVFPDWAACVASELRHGGESHILVAQDQSGGVVGTVLLGTAPERWQDDVGSLVGTLNILGVHPSSQGHGVGLALAAQAMDILRDRGCTRCYIQWTGLVDWYGKLGTRVWAEYRMASKCL